MFSSEEHVQAYWSQTTEINTVISNITQNIRAATQAIFNKQHNHVYKLHQITEVHHSKSAQQQTDS